MVHLGKHGRFLNFLVISLVSSSLRNLKRQQKTVMGVSKVMGVPLYRWMVYFMDNPKIDDLGYPHDLGNLHIITNHY